MDFKTTCRLLLIGLIGVQPLIASGHSVSLIPPAGLPYQQSIAAFSPRSVFTNIGSGDPRWKRAQELKAFFENEFDNAFSGGSHRVGSVQTAFNAAQALDSTLATHIQSIHCILRTALLDYDKFEMIASVLDEMNEYLRKMDLPFYLGFLTISGGVFFIRPFLLTRTERFPNSQQEIEWGVYLGSEAQHHYAGECYRWDRIFMHSDAHRSEAEKIWNIVRGDYFSRIFFALLSGLGSSRKYSPREFGRLILAAIRHLVEDAITYSEFAHFQNRKSIERTLELEAIIHEIAHGELDKAGLDQTVLQQENKFLDVLETKLPDTSIFPRIETTRQLIQEYMAYLAPLAFSPLTGHLLLKIHRTKRYPTIIHKSACIWIDECMKLEDKIYRIFVADILEELPDFIKRILRWIRLFPNDPRKEVRTRARELYDRVLQMTGVVNDIGSSGRSFIATQLQQSV